MKFSNKLLLFSILCGFGIVTSIASYMFCPKEGSQPYQEYFSHLPSFFEKNEGQLRDKEIRYFSKSPFQSTFFSLNSILMAIQNPSAQDDSSTLKLEFIGQKNDSKLKGENLLLNKSHYLIGKNQSDWIKNVSNYSQVVYEELYPGINACFHGNKSTLEYDFIAAPQAEISNIQLRLSGANKAFLNERGDLLLEMNKSTSIVMHKPESYQIVKGEKQSVESHFILLASNDTECTLGFSVGSYQKDLPLVIDPEITYSSFFGGTALSSCKGVAVDYEGNAYLTGWTSFIDAPDNHVIFVSKINAEGTAIIYTTYLGSGSALSSGNALAVDDKGSAYVTGVTYSLDFPTKGSVLSTPLVSETSGTGFVSALSPDGSDLIYSVLLGGSSGCIARSIALDSQKNAYVTGETQSADFPTKNSFSTLDVSVSSLKAFVTAISHDGSEIIYSTVFGGSGDTGGYGIAVDRKRNVYVTGSTNSNDFPGYEDSERPIIHDNGTVFVIKINPQGTDLIYSRFLGKGSKYGISRGHAIAVDDKENAYVTGITFDSHFPQKGKKLAPKSFPPYGVGFLTAINAKGSKFLYSSLLGGNEYATNGPKNEGMTIGRGLSLDSSRNVYITGQTYCLDFPLKGISIANEAVPEHGIAFVSAIKRGGKKFLYSTFLGNNGGDCGNCIASYTNGQAFVAGRTYSMGFPVVGTNLTPDIFPADGVGFITSIKPAANIN